MGYIFTRHCRRLDGIFQATWTGCFNTIYIHGVNTRNRGIYIIKYISWKGCFVYPHVLIATCCWHYFHWTWFDNIIVYVIWLLYLTKTELCKENRCRRCVMQTAWVFLSGSLTRGGGENVPGIPGACSNRNFAYLVRGPLRFGPLISSTWLKSVLDPLLLDQFPSFSFFVSENCKLRTLLVHRP